MLPGFEYLMKKRGLNKEAIRAFHLGYCDPEGHIYVDCDFPNKNLDLDYKFKNSVIFPICNMYGKLIGVSARKLDYETKKDLKYVNTVYPKTDHLYGLNVTMRDCLLAREAFIVEGNLDTVKMYQHGIRNVVGMLGSNLKIKQLCLLSRLVDKVVLVPDGDTAGEKLIEKLTEGKRAIMKNYHNLDLDFEYLQLPEGYDPDTYLAEFGKEQFLKLPRIKLNQSLYEGVFHG